jgi:AcrR family transcriptional regulator
MKRAPGSATRDSILEATDVLLAKYGYKKMTIDDLAREVGIGKGSIYLHFASKEEIVLSHIDRIIERLKANLRSIAGSSLEPDQRLRKMLRERVLFRFDSVQHYSQSLDELLSKIRPSLLERRKKYFMEESKIFAEVIREGQATSGFVSSNADQLARTILLSTNSLLPYSLSVTELGNRSEIDRSVKAIAELLIRGLRGA